MSFPDVETSFELIRRFAGIMRDFPYPWFVCGGWAIDLFLNRVTRPHADLEIGIYRRNHYMLRDYLVGWTLAKAIQMPNGGQWVRWKPDEELQLPVHQILAKPPGDSSSPSIDPADNSMAHASPVEYEFFLHECDATYWQSRRHPNLCRPLDQVWIMSNQQIPILSPEIQLLYKAKQPRQKDRADFDLSLPSLSIPQLDWLSDALRMCHPHHPWLEVLAKTNPCA